MVKQEEFFSPKHKQLLNIATWAKYLAPAVLVVFIIEGIANFFGATNIIASQLNSMGQPITDFIKLFRMFPDEAIKILIESTSILLKGVVYFLTLKGISLGLNMIVETDINYREKNLQGGD